MSKCDVLRAMGYATIMTLAAIGIIAIVSLGCVLFVGFVSLLAAAGF